MIRKFNLYLLICICMIIYLFTMSFCNFDDLTTSTPDGIPLKVITFDTSKYYKIALRNNPLYVLDCETTLANGSNIRLWQYTGTNNQQWKLNDVGSGYYEIVLRYSQSYCIDESQEFPPIDDANIQVWHYLDNDRQKWRFIDVGGGYCKIELKFDPNYCITMAPGTPTDGTNVQNSVYSANDRQQWQLVPVQ